MTIKVLLVDDHAVVRSGLSKFLLVNKDLKLVGEASDGAEAVQMVSLHKPDIVLMWNVLGPTYFFPKLTVFLDQGRTYRTLTTDLNGQTERLTVTGADITIDTLTLGPNDPRCCPTRKAKMHFRWQGGKLVALR